MRRITIGAIVLASVLFAQASAAGTVPRTINFQAQLTDNVGAPVGNVTVDLTFRIYFVSSGGAAQWTEFHNGVVVVDSLFSVQLGSIVAFGLPFDSDYWLSIQVDADAEMSPRFKLAAAPYAIMAADSEQLGGAPAADYALAADLSAASTINTPTNLLEWSQLKNVPGDFADGTDDGTTYTAGTGLTLVGSQFAADIGTSAGQVAEGNHDHTLAGDVSGASGTTTLDAIQGQTVDVTTTAPTDTQVLKWNNAQSRWEPGDDVGGAGSGQVDTVVAGTGISVNAADPVNPEVSLDQTATDALYVNLDGDTMTDRLTLSADPINPMHAATMDYVDTSVAAAGGGDITGVTAGTGLTGGGLGPGDVTLHADFGTAVNTVAQGNHDHIGTYVRLAGGDTMTGALRLNVVAAEASITDAGITKNAAGAQTFNIQNSLGTIDLQVQGNNVWHEGNDGSTSNLDASLLDGMDSADFVAAAGDTMTGQLLVDLAADEVGLVTRGDASQTANLQEWQNVSSTVLASVSAAGDIDTLTGNITSGGNVAATGNVTSASGVFIGNGSGLTDLNAANLTGTISDGRFSAYGNLTAEGYLNNSQDTDLLTRIQADTRYVEVAGDTMAGTLTLNVTDVYGVNINNDYSTATSYGVYGRANGTGAGDRYGVFGLATGGGGTNCGVYGSGTDYGVYSSGNMHATGNISTDGIFNGDGSGLTDLNAANLASGVIDNARFSAYSNLTAEGILDGADGTDLLTRAQLDSRYISTTTNHGGDVTGVYNALEVGNDTHNHTDATISGVVTSVGGTAGTPITIGGTAQDPTVGIPQANGATDGFLDSTDWTTFSSKMAGTATLQTVCNNGNSTTTNLITSGDLQAAGGSFDSNITRWNGGVDAVTIGDGYVRQKDAAGTMVVMSSFTSAGGSVTVYDNTGADRAYMRVDGAGNGNIWAQNNITAGGAFIGDGSGLTDLNASNVNAGTLGDGFFSAYSDLGTDGYLDNNAATDLLRQSDGDGRFVNVTGDAMTGTLSVNPGSDTQALIAQAGASPQTANIQEWQDNSGVVLASVGPDGSISTDGDVNVTGWVIADTVGVTSDLIALGNLDVTLDALVGGSLAVTGTITGDGSGLTNLPETDPQVGTILTSYVPRWNGSALVTGRIRDNGTTVGINGTSSVVQFYLSENKGAVDSGSNYGFYSDCQANDNSNDGSYTSNYGYYAWVRGDPTVAGAMNQNYGTYSYARGSEVAGSVATNYGTYGNAYGTGGAANYGVYGYASGASSTNYGVYGSASGGATNYAGYFQGDVYVTGTPMGPNVARKPKITKVTVWGGTTDSSIGGAYELLKTIGTFTKDYSSADTIIELTFTSHTRITGGIGSFADFQIRVGNVSDPNDTGRAVCYLNSAQIYSPIVNHTIFTNLGAGVHTVSLWVRGSCASVDHNWGNFQMPLIVKEIWNQ